MTQILKDTDLTPNALITSRVKERYSKIRIQFLPLVKGKRLMFCKEVQSVKPFETVLGNAPRVGPLIRELRRKLKIQKIQIFVSRTTTLGQYEYEKNGVRHLVVLFAIPIEKFGTSDDAEQECSMIEVDAIQFQDCLKNMKETKQGREALTEAVQKLSESGSLQWSL